MAQISSFFDFSTSIIIFVTTNEKDMITAVFLRFKKIDHF